MHLRYNSYRDISYVDGEIVCLLDAEKTSAVPLAVLVVLVAVTYN